MAAFEHDERVARGPAARPTPTPRPPVAAVGPPAILALQRSAGNQAVTAALAPLVHQPAAAAQPLIPGADRGRAPYEQLRAGAAAVGNQAFSHRLARKGPGFGNQPHAVDPGQPRGGFGDRPRVIGKRPATSESSAADLPAAVPDHVRNADTINELTPRVVAAEDHTRAAFELLRQQVAAAEGPAKAFVAAHEAVDGKSGYEHEVAANQTAEVKGIARDMEQQRELLQLGGTMLKAIQTMLETAKRRLASAEKALDGHRKLAAAKDLAKKAADYNKELDAAASLVSSAIGLTTAIAGKNPASAAKPLFDALAAVTKLNRENPFDAKAKKAEQEGTALVMDAIQDDIDAARDSVKDAAKLAEDTGEQIKGSAESFEELRHDAEMEYDRTTKGRFHFADLEVRLKNATAVASQSSTVFDDHQHALFLSVGLQSQYHALEIGKEVAGADEAVLATGVLASRELVREQRKRAADAQAMYGRMERLSDSLTTMRNRADRTMLKAPVPRPAAPKRR